MDYFSGVSEAIEKASVAFTETLSTVSSVLQNIAGQAPAGADRDRIVENWLRIARMSKDGVRQRHRAGLRALGERMP